MPSTAERFYVALPDKVTGYETRRLRLKALKMAVAKPSEEDESNTDDDLDDTPATSSEDEEPIYDDQESVSSLSSEELRIMRQKHKRPSLSSSGMRITSDFPSSSQESLPSSQPSTSKRKLYLSTAVPADLHIYTPSQCVCAVERLQKSITDHYVPCVPELQETPAVINY